MSTLRPIYLDYNATTPLDPSVRSVMLPLLEDFWGNPSSIHRIGRRSRVLLDEARERAAIVLGVKPSEIIFTSGGTESNNLAVLGAARALKKRGKHLITSVVEHPAVLSCFDYLEKKEGFCVTRLPVDAEGRIRCDEFLAAIRPDTVFASIMAANNEIGTLQPVGEVGLICRARGIVFHTDAVQWFGKEPFDYIKQFNADLVSICAHKFHGPKGAGALYVKSPFHPDPIFGGGGQENELRAGTENLSAILGFVYALEHFVKVPVFQKNSISPLVKRLKSVIENIDGCSIVSPQNLSLFNTLAFTVRHSDSIALIAGLDVEGICASSGSACSAGSIEPSHVVAALGNNHFPNSLVRFSLGRHTSSSEIDFVCSFLPNFIRRLKVS